MVYYGAIRDTNRQIRRLQEQTRGLRRGCVDVDTLLRDETVPTAKDFAILEGARQRCRRSHRGEETRNRMMRRNERLESRWRWQFPD